MKPLIIILLVAISVQAQTLADIARQERARRAQLNTRAVTTVVSIPVPESKPASADAKPADPKANAAKPAAPATPATPQAPSVDPLKDWNERTDKLRKQVQDLQDQETSLQLQVNQLTNQLFAPVIDQETKNITQTRLGEVQNQLMAVRAELDQTKRTLDAMNQQGPPKP
jgi:hypothetical protein